ncbi:hypothetical protein Ancab_032958, partial [Ancistrocladus abbreviatus]
HCNRFPQILLFEVAWARHVTSSAAGHGRLGLPSGVVRGSMGSLSRTIGTLAAVAIIANSARGMKDSAMTAMICRSKTEVFSKSRTVFSCCAN